MGKKITIKKVEDLKVVQCQNCMHAVISGINVLCTNRKERITISIPKITLALDSCPHGEIGTPSEGTTALNQLLSEYIKLHELIKELTDLEKRLKKMIVGISDHGNYIIGDKVVTIRKYNRTTLDSQKVKKLLEKMGVLNSYTKTTEVIVIRVNEKKDKGKEVMEVEGN